MSECLNRTPSSSRAGSLSLQQALRQLAVEPAPFDDWARMRGSLRLKTTPASNRSWLEFALAASLLMGMALVMLLAPPAPKVEAFSETSHTSSTYTVELEALQRESAWLESMLRQRTELAATAPSFDAETLSARQELTSQLLWVDALLSDQPSADVEQALWQQRVLLLRQLSIEYTPTGVALSSNTQNASAPL